jgi:hypothetical protein
MRIDAQRVNLLMAILVIVSRTTPGVTAGVKSCSKALISY